MKNNKGFTLIELLAVIVILLAISVIAIPSISSLIERNKEKRNNSAKEVIASYAELYYNEHLNEFSSKNNFCKNIDELGISIEELKDANNDKITGIVEYKNGKFEVNTEKTACN